MGIVEALKRARSRPAGRARQSAYQPNPTTSRALDVVFRHLDDRFPDRVQRHHTDGEGPLGAQTPAVD